MPPHIASTTIWSTVQPTAILSRAPWSFSLDTLRRGSNTKLVSAVEAARSWHSGVAVAVLPTAGMARLYARRALLPLVWLCSALRLPKSGSWMNWRESRLSDHPARGCCMPGCAPPTPMAATPLPALVLLIDTAGGRGVMIRPLRLMRVSPLESTSRVLSCPASSPRAGGHSSTTLLSCFPCVPCSCSRRQLT